MKIEKYGFINKKSPFVKWYANFTGIKVFGIKFIGFSIYNNYVVVDIKTLKAKPSIGVWFYIFFYVIYVEIKDPWKGTKYDR